MKIADIRAKSPDQLKDQLIDLKKEQFNLRFQRAGGQLESTGRIRQVRRDIARIKTVMGGGDCAPAPVAAKPAKKTKAVAVEAAPSTPADEAAAPKKAAAKKTSSKKAGTK